MKKIILILLILSALPVYSQTSGQLAQDLQYAQYLTNNGRQLLAYTTLNNIIKENRGCAEAYYLRSICYRADGNMKSAESDISQALKLSPLNAKYLVETASQMLQQKKKTRALEYLNKAVNTDSAYVMSTDSRKLMAAEIWAESQTIDAIRTINSVENTSANLYRVKGMAYTAAGQNSQAIELLGKAIDVDPKLTDCYIWRGMAHYQNGNSQKAHADWNTAIRKGHTDARKYIERYQ